MNLRVPGGPYYDPARFEFLCPLVADWHAIRDEALALRDEDMMPYPVGEFYRGDWKVFGLYSDPYPGWSEQALAPVLNRNRARCPATVAASRGVPGNSLVGFSIIDPGCEILPHSHERGLFICHLGLVVPDGCAIEVESEQRQWREGELLVFHETSTHRAWNRGTSRRIALLVDFNP